MKIKSKASFEKNRKLSIKWSKEQKYFVTEEILDLKLRAQKISLFFFTAPSTVLAGRET